ncbi:unnamed protein product [Phyllotreta striolata]|uniref:acylglycerol lipase n=1 Tax=Phyllotreta striolata TaxID=444603 RepID=A0A9N9XKM5_PHYSR|nr:unnamed protein product [Phyllotreta striolata]
MTEHAGVEGCFPKVVTSWNTFLSTLNAGHRIHPLDQTPPTDCFIRKSVILSQPVLYDSTNSKRCSLSEEYWFSKWNRPFKIGNCDCSFRRSMRYSIISNQPSVRAENSRKTVSCTEQPPIKITNLTTFVERLIQETFLEAFHEYYMLQTKSEGIKGTGQVNLGYEITDEENEVITIRKKLKSNEKAASFRTDIRRASPKKSCVHKKNQKPLIMLFHGIGTSADIWTLVINALSSRGYEVVAPDMLGHGFSSAPMKPSYYTFNNLLLQALTIFDHYMADSKRKCVLIGHSYGCSLITALFPHRVQQIRQLILISSGGPTPLAPPVKDNEISPFGCIYTLLNPLLYCGVKRSLFFSIRGKHFKTCDEENGLPRHVIDNIANGQKWLQGDTAFHRRITAPTLLIHGLQDKHVTLVQECEMERTIPRAFLELIPNSGHLPMVETPERLIHMITCFLDMWT